jgi:hypothetical protein
MSRKYTIEDMQKWAIEYNGECLSKEYVNSHTKLKWQCEKCHVFWKRPNSVQQGNFCPQCGIEERTQKQKCYNIKDMKKIAQKFNGDCLSKKYINNHTKLKWKCKRGHVWHSTPNSVMSAGKWCRKCAYIDKKNISRNTIDDAYELASKNGGKLLTNIYENCMKKMKWKCEKGHIFEMNYNTVQQGSWCPICAKNKNYSIENVKNLAHENGCMLVSNEYKNAHEKLQWKCLKCGDIWATSFGNIIYNKSSCPRCSHEKRCQSKIQYNINDLKNYAHSQNGRCLSVKYCGFHKKHTFMCKRGHIWDASWANIQNNRWCPYCAHGKSENEFRKVIEELLDVEFPRKYPPWLINPETGHKLQLDGYNKELGIAFEYQGHQHFKRAYYDKNDNALKKRQARDKIKKELCKKQGITLLCPTYKMDEEEYEDFIKINLNI